MNRISTTNNDIDLWLSPQLEASFREIFEIEILQGTREVLENGDLYFHFQLSDEKIEATRLALLQVISKSNDIIFS